MFVGKKRKARWVDEILSELPWLNENRNLNTTAHQLHVANVFLSGACRRSRRLSHAHRVSSWFDDFLMIKYEFKLPPYKKNAWHIPNGVAWRDFSSLILVNVVVKLCRTVAASNVLKTLVMYFWIVCYDRISCITKIPSCILRQPAQSYTAHRRATCGGWSTGWPSAMQSWPAAVTMVRCKNCSSLDVLWWRNDTAVKFSSSVWSTNSSSWVILDSQKFFI